MVISPSRSDYYLDADVYDRSGRRSVYDHDPNESASEFYRSSYALNSSRSVSPAAPPPPPVHSFVSRWFRLKESPFNSVKPSLKFLLRCSQDGLEAIERCFESGATFETAVGIEWGWGRSETNLSVPRFLIMLFHL